MNTIRPSLVVALVLPLCCGSVVAYAQLESDPFGHDSITKPYSNPYNNPFNSYPDGSSRPLNPGPGNRWNDDDYNARQRQQQQEQLRRMEQQERLSAAPTPPAASHDFNVWEKGKAPRLCTVTPRTGDVY